MKSVIFIVLVVLLAGLSSGVQANESVDNLLRKLESNHGKSAKNAAELLIQSKENYPHIIKKVVDSIVSSCEPIAIFADNREDNKKLSRQYNLRKLEAYMYVIAEILVRNPILINKIDPLFKTENQCVALVAIGTAGELGKMGHKFIPAISKFMHSETLNDYSKEMFFKKGGRALKKIGTAEAGEVMKIAKMDIEQHKVAQAELKKKVEAELKGSDIQRWKQMQFDKITLTVQRFHAAINTFRNKYNGLAGDFTKAKAFLGVAENGDGNGKIEGKESQQVWEQLLKSHMIGRIPTSELEGVSYWIGYYTSHGRSGNALLIGSKSPDGMADGAAFTPSDASALYHKLKGNDAFIVNGKGRDDCLKDGKYNMANKEKSCALVVWI